MPLALLELLEAFRALPAEDQQRFVGTLVGPGAARSESDESLRAELGERDAIERALLESQQELADVNHMLRLVLDAIPVRVYWKDRTLRFLGCNRRFAEDAGAASPDALIGKTERDLAWRRDAERRESDDRGVLETGRALVDRVEPQLNATGELRWVRHTRARFEARSGVAIGVLGTYDDVTERRHLQQRLHEAEHMEAVAQLAGGVAHDFNNLLTGILGNAELICEDADPRSETEQAASEILRAARRAADLTQQLLAFSRRGRMQSQPVDMHGLIEQTMKLMMSADATGYTVRARLDAQRAIVNGDPTQLGSALVDLVRNAREAMAGGGELRFATHNVYLDDATAATLGDGLAPGDFVEIRVEDTGSGIAPEIIGRVFDPFFTTKGRGGGSGLGLAAVFGTVKGHGGHVLVASTPGRGTTFTLLLPVGSGPVRRSTPVRVNRPVLGRGRVLVVDDEETVRAFVARSLVRLGYEVVTFADGPTALDHFASHHQEADLVILDLTMPRLSGEETFRKLREIDPDVRVLVASGHSREATADALLAAGARAFLAKPFRAHELASEVALHVRPNSAAQPDPVAAD